MSSRESGESVCSPQIRKGGMRMKLVRRVKYDEGNRKFVAFYIIIGAEASFPVNIQVGEGEGKFYIHRNWVEDEVVYWTERTYKIDEVGKIDEDTKAIVQALKREEEAAWKDRLFAAEHIGKKEIDID
jgi:hypothetical protein